MHDIKFIRDNPDIFDAALKRRGLAPVAQQLIERDRQRRDAMTEVQRLQAQINEISKAIGNEKRAGRDAAGFIADAARLKDELAGATAAEGKTAVAVKEFEEWLATLPNIPADDVPDGPDETANEELHRVGHPPGFNFQPLEHDAIGTGLGLMDFEAAARLSGARFTVLRGPLARLERAIAQFMLDHHTLHFGYTEISPPTLVRDQALYGTGNLPKFAEDLFKTTNDPALWLIPTAEVPLTNLVAGEILDEAQLPLRFTAHTPCYRSEAGSAGKDTRGMIRQHQFYKVELVSIAHPDHSGEEHERMTACAEDVLKQLGLPYRVVLLCTGDMGFASRKTYDIEVWLPGQNTYREISSCSNCGDFQARRMNARFRTPGEKGTRFVHTLNGSGLAVGRTLVAILENYQRADGSVAIPDALQPYLGGMKAITKNG